ncbi:MAG: SPOR domain-containing protein, partial [Gemmatimonadota bacterium]
QRGGSSGHPLTWTLLVVLMASLLAGAWHFLAQRLAPVAAGPPTDTAAARPVAPAPLPLRSETAMSFVVALEAHRDLGTAVERVVTLTAAEPAVGFHVAPLEREGTLFYHVMAGPLADSASAVALRDSLIARGHKTVATSTDIRAAPLAFLVAEHASRAEAVDQLDTLLQLDVPGYVLATEDTGGATRYRVYIGGFGTRAEADVIRQLLRSAGIRDSLVTRTGSITP